MLEVELIPLHIPTLEVTLILEDEPVDITAFRINAVLILHRRPNQDQTSAHLPRTRASTSDFNVSILKILMILLMTIISHCASMEDDNFDENLYKNLQHQGREII